MKIDFIMKQGLQELDRDKLTLKAAADLILSAMMGLYPNPKQAQTEAHNACKAIESGQTIEIKNPTTNVCLIFQVPDIKKEREAHKKLVN